MALITFQLIEGLERGRIYENVSTPVSLGREEDNTIQLNDERVSRFHAKVQDDDGRIILTDLDSTNGTRVNGHPVQMRVLQVGDQVSIGRCVLVFGSRDDIAARFGIDSRSPEDSHPSNPSEQTIAAASEHFDDMLASLTGSKANVPAANLFPHGPPPPPGELRPSHRAQVSDFVAYVHDQLRLVLLSAAEQDPDLENSPMELDRPTWQRLLQLEMDLAVYLRRLADPSGD